MKKSIGLFLLLSVMVSSVSAGTVKMIIASQKGDCVGVAPQKCFYVKKDGNPNWEFFYSQIEGFAYEEGYEYVLEVKEEKLKNVPADASSIKYTLVKQVSKTATSSANLPEVVKPVTKAAFIYVAPKNDPSIHRAVIDSPVIHLTVVGVVDYNEAEKIAQELVADGITTIELCAGFGNEGTARIAKSVGDKAIVGVVRFDLHPAFGNKSGDTLF